jgi:hypothetical protein
MINGERLAGNLALAALGADAAVEAAQRLGYGLSFCEPKFHLGEITLTGLGL